MIFNFKEFITEGLIKTYDINIVKSKEYIFLSKLNIDYNFEYYSDRIFLNILNFKRIQNVELVIDSIESFMINMMGWFPSKVKITNISGIENYQDYNKYYLIDNSEFIDNIKIIFESKFDLEINVPEKIYHLTIRQFENDILKNGLIPKSKSKLTQHPDRIYVCSSKIGCLSLVNHMKFFYSSEKWKKPLSKKDIRWVIFEIDTTGLNLKLYSDPNYLGGYYVLNNIPPEKVKVIDREK